VDAEEHAHPQILARPEPIDQVFSKLKHGLRKAQARSWDALLKTTADLLQTYSPEECANYLKNSGYGATYNQNALGVEPALAGASDSEIMSQLEHADSRTAQIYRRQAERSQLAASAQNKVDQAIRARIARKNAQTAEAS
jgi:hypothetical protein